MIGDRKHDLIGGTRNGLDVVAVGYGFGSHEELAGQAPTYHFETMADLRAAFAKR
jgi:phosphoglycolate phosphatase